MKKKAAGESGAAKNYITRARAIKKLQLSLPDFRRICILKGIYPRQPKSTKKANKGSTAPRTFYYQKDIQYLLQEPVLDKFRQQRTTISKIKRAKGKKDFQKARIMGRKIEKIQLDRIIKERYPTFSEALNDLDDAVALVALFARLPADKYIPQNTIETCSTLIKEFKQYCEKTHALKKAFLSIKGIYYEVEIANTTIRWIEPYEFIQSKPADVDFRIMLTFIDLYVELLTFVNYRLYTEIGEIYPPTDNSQAMEIPSTIKAAVDASLSEPTPIDDVPRLMSGLTFELSREVPRQHMSFMLKCLGGTIVESGAQYIITDREKGKYGDKIAVQPQWVVDALNKNEMFAMEYYKPGVVCPPHLSPWDDYEPEEEEDREEEDEEAVEEQVIDESKENPAEIHAARKEMQKMMMTKKDARLYKKMNYSNAEKKAEADNLKRKREMLKKTGSTEPRNSKRAKQCNKE